MLAALLVAIAALLPAASAEASPTGKKLNRALDRIDDHPQGPPGISVAIRRNGVTQFRRRGVSNLVTGRRPEVRDHMRLASMAKAYNGAVVLSLVDDGRLSLDDTVGEWLGDLLPLAEDVTVAEALHHTGGLPDYIKDPDFIERLLAAPRKPMSPRRMLGYIRETPLTSEPGTEYEYSDTDNIVLGLIAEEASSRTYDELLERVIYAPLALTQTSLPPTVKMPQKYMHGYEVAPGKPPEDVSKLITPALAGASGGIVSSPKEVGRFFRSYVRGRFFGEPTRHAQRRFIPGRSSPPGPGRNAAGLGLFRYRTQCGVVYGHTGSFPGYRQFAASSDNGRRSVVFSVSAQITPGEGSPRVSKAIRRAQRLAVCHALR